MIDLYPIEYCSRCKCDTIPLQPQGICAFCDKQLTAMVFGCGHAMSELNTYVDGYTHGSPKLACTTCRPDMK